MEDHKLADVIRLNRPALGSEAAMFVAAIADGNVRLALVLAEAVQRSPRAIAAHLITLDVIRVYVTESLPSGADFLASCALALLTRIGVSGDAASELALLANGLHLPVTDLRAAARTLTELGLLNPKGRYESVAPQPLAVYLAAKAWEDFENEIVDELAPNLPPALLELLVDRAAEVGPNPEILRLVDSLVDRADIFGSLGVLEEGNHLGLIRPLAILVPRKVMDVLARLIHSASTDELRATKRSRRALVRTLEALAWHSSTFETAADALLSLALVEIENFANNATGAWRALFGVMLPNTAASPAARIAYLKRVSDSEVLAVRRLAVSAAAVFVQAHETSFVSGERQLGVLVEKRGKPATYGDVWAYQRAGFQLLRQFADDPEPDISKAAVDALIKAIHPFLGQQMVRDDLFQVLATLPGPALRRVRSEVTHLGGLFKRVSSRASDVEGRQAGLQLLVDALPAENPYDRLHSLLQTRRWDLEDGELQRRISEAVKTLLATQPVASIVAILNEEKWEAAFEFGYSLTGLLPDAEGDSRLAALVGSPNSPALVGYLHARVDRGDVVAFDNFVDGPLGQAMTPNDRLFITVRGPQSERGWARALDLVSQLTPRDGATGLSAGM